MQEAQGTTIYGSTAAGNTQYATDIGMLQNNAWETGIEAAVVVDNAPILQDDNSVRKVITQQLAYLFQKGIPEWEEQTTYFKGNLCMLIIDNIPNLFYSLIDNNLNNNPINSSNSWTKLQLGGQIIGQIISVMSTGSYIPSGCLPCDGSEYNKTQFLELWNNYLTATTPLLETCTYEEYQQDIATYGQCIKFAIDTDNNKFKVPTIKDGSYLTQAKNDTELGKSYNESLPNITGKLNNLYSVAAGVDGSFTTITGSNGNTYTSGSQTKVIGFDASLSSNTYQDNAKVQGDNVRLRFFVVVANGEINQAQMDWSAWATSLSAKANTDLNNLTTVGKELVYTAGAPDYAKKTDITINVEYTAASNGYIYLTGTEAAGIRYYLTINNLEFQWDNTASANASSFSLMPIAKGDTYQVTSASGAINNYEGYFIPVKTF